MSNFVDECNLNVRAGDGGAGCVAFRREAHVARGGPAGGDGGRGGEVWLVADRNVASLLSFRDHPHRRAGDGRHGSGNKRHGARGADLEVPVPVGTVVRHHETGEPLADLCGHGDRWLAARAGEGGRGNARFLTNRRRAPAFAEQGERGESRWLRLELKLLADAAIVGLPNVGKSTFISRVSAAKPKIADYPFTTLEPNLGVVRTDDTEMVLADVPGLVSGASEGRGLGHRFLRHIERARVLLIMLDLAPGAAPPPAEQQAVLLTELERYRPDLLDRPRLVVGSRADLAPGVGREEPPAVETSAESDCEAQRAGETSGGSGGGARPADKTSGGSGGGARRADETSGGSGGGAQRDAETGAESGFGGLRVSSVTGLGVSEVTGELARMVTAARTAEPAPTGAVVHRPEVREIGVSRSDDGSWAVSGRAAVRAVALSDLTDPEALAYAQGRLDRLGVDKALAKAGAASGDVVHIGDLTFTYEENR